jgi:DNA-binding NarL/FixJ family response regulator
MPKHKILIADDHAMIRDGIKTLLKQNRDYVVAGEAVNGNEAVEKYKILSPDLVILDISMPGLNGMEAAREILEDDPAARIIMLSMYDDEDYISQCIEYGVKGFVVKNESGGELDYAIKSVLDGRNYFSNRVQEVIVKKYTSAATRRRQKEPEVKLTSREMEIIKLISDGLTSQQMADKLFISPRTVETHRANLMKKVGVKNAIELVKKAEKMGLFS